MATKPAQSEVLLNVEEALDVIDKTMERVKSLYEQYFLGIQKQPPTFIHNDLERKLRDLAQVQIRNTALRYRYATLQQKFGSYNSYWRRTLRQIENGTYTRSLAKLGRKSVETGEDIPEEILAKMPKRMREAVKRDREQARALAARRKAAAGDAVEAPPDDGGDFYEDFSRPAAGKVDARGAHILDEDDADLDLDKFFAAVTEEEESEPTQSGPPPTPAAPANQRAAMLGGMPRAQSPAVRAQTTPGVPATPTPPAAQPLGSAFRTQSMPAVSPAEGQAPSQAGAPLARITPVPAALRTAQQGQSPSQPGVPRAPGQSPQAGAVGSQAGVPPGRASQPAVGQAPSQPGVPAGRASQSQPGVPAGRASQPAVGQAPSQPGVPGQASRESQPAVGQAPPQPGVPRPVVPPVIPPQRTQAVPVVPPPARAVPGQLPPVPAPGSRPSQPALPPLPSPGVPRPITPATEPVRTQPMPALQRPPGVAPSQVSRPNPIAPGASANKSVPVESMSGPFPRRAKRDTDLDAGVEVPQAPTPAPAPMRATPTPQPMRPASTPQRPSQPIARTASQPGQPRPKPPGMSDADVDSLYQKYVKAKEMVGEQTNAQTYGKLLNTINAQAPKIMEQYKAKGVDFSVVVKDNQVIIKAKPKP